MASTLQWSTHVRVLALAWRHDDVQGACVRAEPDARAVMYHITTLARQLAPVTLRAAHCSRRLQCSRCAMRSRRCSLQAVLAALLNRVDAALADTAAAGGGAGMARQAARALAGGGARDGIQVVLRQRVHGRTPAARACTRAAAAMQLLHAQAQDMGVYVVHVLPGDGSTLSGQRLPLCRVHCADPALEVQGHRARLCSTCGLLRAGIERECLDVSSPCSTRWPCVVQNPLNNVPSTKSCLPAATALYWATATGKQARSPNSVASLSLPASGATSASLLRNGLCSTLVWMGQDTAGYDARDQGLKRRRTSQGDPPIRVPPATAPPAASTPPPSTAPPAASTTPPSTAPPATSTTPPSTAPPASAPSAIQTTSTSAPSAIQTTSTLPSTAPPTAHPGRRAATHPKRHKYTSAPCSGAEAHATRRAPGPQFLFYPLVRHITAGLALPKPRRAPPFPIWKAGGGEL
ncbi:hypothetical protein GGX14DRAFT_398240 [Mycena pura]|uniref:Uncharacterized protein n=1 Tax=Mycena pura TaxID=153505 RepID=A0AAD6VDZ4_9AGAR|nr:hypothetical protein GGX14DRAFT_398240 [Mycena pura]